MALAAISYGQTKSDTTSKVYKKVIVKSDTALKSVYTIVITDTLNRKEIKEQIRKNDLDIQVRLESVSILQKNVEVLRDRNKKLRELLRKTD